MDLKDTRQIPMWQASPFLPVGAGVLLFGVLAILTLTEAPAEPLPDVGAVDSSRIVPTHNTAGAPALPDGARPAPVDLKKANALAREGDFMGALKIYQSLPERQRAMFAADTNRMMQSAAERLLFDIDKGRLDRVEALEKLHEFLALKGVDEHPVRPKVEAKLTAIIEAAEREGGDGGGS